MTQKKQPTISWQMFARKMHQCCWAHDRKETNQQLANVGSQDAVLFGKWWIVLSQIRYAEGDAFCILVSLQGEVDRSRPKGELGAKCTLWGPYLSIKEVFEGKFCARISSQKPAFVSILAFFFFPEKAFLYNIRCLKLCAKSASKSIMYMVAHHIWLMIRQ